MASILHPSILAFKFDSKCYVLQDTSFLDVHYLMDWEVHLNFSLQPQAIPGVELRFQDFSQEVMDIYMERSICNMPHKWTCCVQVSDNEDDFSMDLMLASHGECVVPIVHVMHAWMQLQTNVRCFLAPYIERWSLDSRVEHAVTETLL